MDEKAKLDNQCCDKADNTSQTKEMDIANEENDVVQNLQNEIESLKQKAEEYKDLLQRVQADFDNYRKRNVNSVQEAYRNGSLDAVKQFLPILDNLERASKAAEATQDFKVLSEGIDMVIKQFMSTLNKMGIEEIEALGKPFDPNLHDAVMSVEADENQDLNLVVEVFQKGYKVEDKVLRHSLVKVTN